VFVCREEEEEEEEEESKIFFFCHLVSQAAHGAAQIEMNQPCRFVMRGNNH